MSYAGRSKYDEPGRASRYRQRSPRRDAEEWALLERALTDLPSSPTSAWDAPCGTGRIAERLLARGIATWCGDLSPAMRAETEARLASTPGLLGIEAIDLDAAEHVAGACGRAPEQADLAICFRFFHHLPTHAHRLRALRALTRLSRRDLLLSFHHPVSAHNLERVLARLLRGKRSDRHTISPRALRRVAAEAGWLLRATYPLGRYRRELWVAHLTRPPS